MPRLLLVDDNPSIHKIAETLLSRSGIELVCVDSAAQALRLIESGEHFDVALLDTAMSGMDGWELLDRLRSLPATARIPIAMMAGVLDQVDPQRIERAPIQGFLKKPVELRDLGDRVRTLLETPVPPPPEPEPEAEPVSEPANEVSSPFVTLPSRSVSDFASMIAPQAAPAEALPTDDGGDDILELVESDLFIEEPADHAAFEVGTSLDIPGEEPLDLEELDLEGLKELPPPDVQVSTPSLVSAAPIEDAFADLTPPYGYAVPDEGAEIRATMDKLPALDQASALEAPVSAPEEFVDFPDLGPIESQPLETADSMGIVEPVAAPMPEASAEPILDWMDESESMLAPKAAPVAQPVVEAPQDIAEEPVLDLSETELDVLESEISAPIATGAEAMAFKPLEETQSVPDITEEDTAPGLSEGVEHLPEALDDLPTGHFGTMIEPLVEAPAKALPEPIAEPGIKPLVAAAPAVASSREIVDAILADPALVDAISRAVVARLGDQTLREIAWEVIPELAERLQIH